MRDWQRYVLENLGPMHLNSAEFEGVAQELAAHLEETYEKLRSSGLSEEQADLQTRAQAGNWKKLRSGVMSAKKEDSMENRVSQLWVPGIVTLFGSAVFFAGLEYMGVHPVVLGPSAILLYVPWLLGLPVFGALGAFLARRARRPRSDPPFECVSRAGYGSGDAIVADRRVVYKPPALPPTENDWILAGRNHLGRLTGCSAASGRYRLSVDREAEKLNCILLCVSSQILACALTHDFVLESRDAHSLFAALRHGNPVCPGV